MRLIKAFIAGLFGLVIVITLFSLLIPSRVRVSRVVLINSTAGNVYSQIASFANWQNWHPVFTIDSALIIWHSPAIAGEDSGCIIMHRGREIIIRLLSKTYPTSVKFLLQAEGENDINNDIVITHLPSSDAVQVEWRAETKLHWYPWEKVYGIFIDKLAGPGYEAALTGLKDFIENKSSLAQF